MDSRVNKLAREPLRNRQTIVQRIPIVSVVRA